MTVKEIIEVLEVAKAEIEWEYPIDYQEAFDSIIAILKKQEKLKYIEYDTDCDEISKMTCKDCIHYGLCEQFGCFDMEIGGNLSYKICNDFKIKKQLKCPDCGHILEQKWEEETNEEILENSFYHCPKCLATYKCKRILQRYFFG